MLFDDTKKGRVNRMILPPFVITLRPRVRSFFLPKCADRSGEAMRSSLMGGNLGKRNLSECFLHRWENGIIKTDCDACKCNGGFHLSSSGFFQWRGKRLARSRPSFVWSYGSVLKERANMRKRLLAMVLAFAMLFSTLPVAPIFARGG